MPNNTPLD